MSDLTAEALNARNAAQILALTESNRQLKQENTELKSLLKCGNSPCGHSDQYAYSEDGGKKIICLLCRSNEVTQLRTILGETRQLIEMEERSVFRQNNPYGKEVRELLNKINLLLHERRTS
jgi:hypothetical protein